MLMNYNKDSKREKSCITRYMRDESEIENVTDVLCIIIP